MDKVWIVEEIRKDKTTAIMGVHATLESAHQEVLEWEEVVRNDKSGELYTITVMRVRK